jgi:hypothetical protein
MDKLFKANTLVDEALEDARKPFLDDEHSKAVEDGGRQVLPQYIKEFLKAQSEVLEQETDVDIKKVRIEDIGDIEISDADMDTIAFMIEE